jgi:hypothetical protein
MGRDQTNLDKLKSFMCGLAQRVGSGGRIYVTGGASAVWYGWRAMTVDIDLKADPEPQGFFEAIAHLKDSLSVNVELASPDQFIPELPGWRERSPWFCREGSVDFHHYDFYSQALAKLERRHPRDLTDVAAMKTAGLIETDKIAELFAGIEPRLIRYPAVDAISFKAAVLQFCAGHEC